MEKSLQAKIDRYIEKYKVVKINPVDKRPHFMNIKVFKCTLNNGITIIREECLKNKSSGDIVTTMPITIDKKIVMVAQPRVLTPLTVGFELPAGYIEKNETPIIAAKRELIEETGYTPNQIEEIIKFQNDPGCSRAVSHCFVATDCKKTSPQNLDESEYIEFFECTLDDAMEMMDKELVVGSSSVITLSKIYERRKKYGI